MQLESARLWMMGWEASDCSAFRPIATDPEVMRYISDGQPWPDERIREFVHRQIEHLASHGFCLWKLVHKRDHHLLGFCGIQPVTIAERDEVEIGWWPAREHWGNGLATEAARMALWNAFERAEVARVIAFAARQPRLDPRHGKNRHALRTGRDAQGH